MAGNYMADVMSYRTLGKFDLNEVGLIRDQLCQICYYPA